MSAEIFCSLSPLQTSSCSNKMRQQHYKKCSLVNSLFLCSQGLFSEVVFLVGIGFMSRIAWRIFACLLMMSLGFSYALWLCVCMCVSLPKGSSDFMAMKPAFTSLSESSLKKPGLPWQELLWGTPYE